MPNRPSAEEVIGQIDPSKLWALAEWFDATYPNDPNPEVQNDLRHWARLIVRARGMNEAALDSDEGKLGASGIAFSTGVEV